MRKVERSHRFAKDYAQRGVEIDIFHLLGLSEHYPQYGEGIGELVQTTTTTYKVGINHKVEHYSINLISSHTAKGYNEGRILLKSSAQYGGTIFWKPNKENKANEGYDWKNLFVQPGL